MKLQHVSIGDTNEDGITAITMQNVDPLILDIIKKTIKLDTSELHLLNKHIDKRVMISRYNDISGEYQGDITYKNAIDGVVSKGYIKLDIRYIYHKDTNEYKEINVYSLFKTSFNNTMYSSDSNSIGEVIFDGKTLKYDFENKLNNPDRTSHKGTAYLKYDKENFRLYGYYITDKGIDYRGEINLNKTIKK